MSFDYGSNEDVIGSYGNTSSAAHYANLMNYNALGHHRLAKLAPVASVPMNMNYQQPAPTRPIMIRPPTGMASYGGTGHNTLFQPPAQSVLHGQGYHSVDSAY